MPKFIPLSVPNLRGNELAYVTEAIEAEWVSTGGSFINRLERELAAYLGMAQAVACQSGTAGLHLALQLCGVGAGQEVLVPTLTFIAAVNPVRYCGAEPVFLDCDDSFCIDPVKLDTFCAACDRAADGSLINPATKKPITALVVVHVFGNAADLERIMDTAARYRLKVVEDATEALGTRYETGRYTGRFCGTIGDFGVFSFNGNKIVTTGGGGAMVSTHPELLAKAKYLSTQAKDDELYFVHGEVGYNYRMTNLQAAVGVAQLEQLETFIGTKRRNFELYRELVASLPGIQLSPFRESTRPNYWFYSLIIDAAVSGIDRDGLMHALHAANIQSRPVWKLNHEQAPYRNNQLHDATRAGEFWRTVLNVPCSTNLSEDDVGTVVAAIATAMKGLA